MRGIVELLFPEGLMDFDLSNEQKDIMKAAREFAEGEFPDLGDECDRKED
jgi:hypothetical protein